MTEIADYIRAGVAYDHYALKQAYYDACADLCGTEFRLTLHRMYRRGEVDMPRVQDRHGDKVDFFTAVIAAHHRDNPKFKLVIGELILTTEAVTT